MEIIIGKTAGFCYGVKRAVEQAKKEVKEQKTTYCLGELVHNTQVIEELEECGVKFIDDIKEVNDKENRKLIIRAHGVSKDIYEYVEKFNIKIIDLTCPNVLEVHNKAKRFTEKGYFIFITGKKDHPENLGTISYCDNYVIIEEPEETEKAIEIFEKSGIKKLLLISQTTYDMEKFYLIREKISYKIDKNVELKIENTICHTTQIRQDETQKISKRVECMIIVGGKNSSNTKKIYEIAQKNCKNVLWVENKIDIELIKNYKSIGIMAGASTPRESIEKVLLQIKNIHN